MKRLDMNLICQSHPSHKLTRQHEQLQVGSNGDFLFGDKWYSYSFEGLYINPSFGRLFNLFTYCSKINSRRGIDTLSITGGV